MKAANLGPPKSIKTGCLSSFNFYSRKKTKSLLGSNIWNIEEQPGLRSKQPSIQEFADSIPGPVHFIEIGHEIFSAFEFLQKARGKH